MLLKSGGSIRYNAWGPVEGSQESHMTLAERVLLPVAELTEVVRLVLQEQQMLESKMELVITAFPI